MNNDDVFDSVGGSLLNDLLSDLLAKHYDDGNPVRRRP